MGHTHPFAVLLARVESHWKFIVFYMSMCAFMVVLPKPPPRLLRGFRCHFRNQANVQCGIHWWGVRFQTAHTDAETVACVAFCDLRVLGFHCCVHIVRADIMLAHISCAEKAKKAFYRTFIACFRNGVQSPKGMITKPYAHAGFASGEGRECV